MKYIITSILLLVSSVVFAQGGPPSSASSAREEAYANQFMANVCQTYAWMKRSESDSAEVEALAEQAICVGIPGHNIIKEALGDSQLLDGSVFEAIAVLKSNSAFSHWLLASIAITDGDIAWSQSNWDLSTTKYILAATEFVPAIMEYNDAIENWNSAKSCYLSAKFWYNDAYTNP